MDSTKMDIVKALIELSQNWEDADKIILEFYGFKTTSEKIAFVKGIFDVECIGHERDTDEMTYAALLTSVLLINSI